MLVVADSQDRLIGQVLAVTDEGYRVQIAETLRGPHGPTHHRFTYDVRTDSDEFRIGLEFYRVVSIT